LFKNCTLFQLHLLLLIALFAPVNSVFAQVDNASLTGLISDSTGAVVPGARVAIVNQATNIASEAVTSDDGYYNFANLRPGLYTISAEKNGFQRQNRTDVRLSVDQRRGSISR
jgi:protocatechuate 3,4-dioxygenase beta subunit